MRARPRRARGPRPRTLARRGGSRSGLLVPGDRPADALVEAHGRLEFEETAGAIDVRNAHLHVGVVARLELDVRGSAGFPCDELGEAENGDRGLGIADIEGMARG